MRSREIIIIFFFSVINPNILLLFYLAAVFNPSNRWKETKSDKGGEGGREFIRNYQNFIAQNTKKKNFYLYSISINKLWFAYTIISFFSFLSFLFVVHVLIGFYFLFAHYWLLKFLGRKFCKVVFMHVCVYIYAYVSTPHSL